MKPIPTCNPNLRLHHSNSKTNNQRRLPIITHIICWYCFEKGEIGIMDFVNSKNIKDDCVLLCIGRQSQGRISYCPFFQYSIFIFYYPLHSFSESTLWFFFLFSHSGLFLPLHFLLTREFIYLSSFFFVSSLQILK